MAVLTEVQNCAESSDLKRDEECLVEEEVPAGHEAPGIVHPFTTETNEATRDRHKGRHFSHTVVNQREHTTVDCVRQEDTCWTAFVEGTADGDEERCTDRSTDGEELDLPAS